MKEGISFDKCVVQTFCAESTPKRDGRRACRLLQNTLWSADFHTVQPADSNKGFFSTFPSMIWIIPKTYTSLDTCVWSQMVVLLGIADSSPKKIVE